ncbi:uncharacterized protein LOC115048515 isoform X2 [Echeneis naucrates]|nr:uncharacterized protein LOC115048515 isoform X2 [Echeneis naucrates]
MAKGKGKINSSDSLGPPQPQSLRSGKKEGPSDETAHAQAALHQQHTGENNTTVADTSILCPQSPPQENQQDQAVSLSCLKNKEETHAEETNVLLKNMVKAFGQEDTNVASPCYDAEGRSFEVQIDNDTDRSGTEGISSQRGVRSPSQTYTDKLNLLPTSEEADGSFAYVLKKQLAATDNFQCNLDRNHEARQEEPSNIYMADVKEISNEVEAGLPPKKKRRMGMCGLTERERSHFLQIQKHENGQNRGERVERQISNGNRAALVAQEEIVSSLLPPSSVSIPLNRNAEQSEAEIKLSLCGEDDRTETEVQITVITSDGTGTVCDPCCSETKSEAVGDTELGTEQTGAPKSDPPTQDKTGNQDQELNITKEITTEMAEAHTKDGENKSTEMDCSPAIDFYTNPNQKEETERKDGSETNPLGKENIMADVDAEAEPGGFNGGAVELCEDVRTPTDSERRENGDRDDEPSPSVNADVIQTKDTTGPFGSGCLEYVSDSQLNTIVMIKDEGMERKEAGSSGCQDDATDLICGLIRELSSLNRKVMTMHRELENLRRGSKTLRSSNH